MKTTTKYRVLGALATALSLARQSAWRWVRWDTTSNEVSELAELEPSTSDVLWFESEGHVYGTETTSDYSETTLVDLTAAGGSERKLTVPGFLHGLARSR